MARVAVGKAAPSPTPSAKRAATSDTKAADRPGERGGGGGGQAEDAQRPSGAEPVAEPAADELQRRVGIGEDGEGEAERGFV
jgi:hypothetical protein